VGWGRGEVGRACLLGGCKDSKAGREGEKFSAPPKPPFGFQKHGAISRQGLFGLLLFLSMTCSGMA
jgi:hypothetical protein